MCIRDRFGAAVSTVHGVAPLWPTTAWFTLSLVLGMIGGRLAVLRLPEAWIKRVFVALVVGVALVMAVDVSIKLAR